MQILIADKFPESGLAHLESQGHDVDFQPDLTGDDLPGAVAQAEVLIVRSTKVSAATIEAAPSLALIVRAGAGTNTIDKQAAADHAVYVSNVPGRNAIAVAELTLGLILAIDRRIPDNVADLRTSTWNKATYSKGTGLLGRSLGIVGVGAIGLAVATRAASFGLELHAVEKAAGPGDGWNGWRISASCCISTLAALAGVGRHPQLPRAGHHRHQESPRRRSAGGRSSRNRDHQHVTR